MAPLTPLFILVQFASRLVSNRALAWSIYRRSLWIRYRQSFLGVIWNLFFPFVWMLLLVFLKAQGWVNFSGPAGGGPVSLMAGLTLWQLFVDMFYVPMNSVTHGSTFLNRTRVEEEALIGAEICIAAVNFGIRLLCVLLLAALTKNLSFAALAAIAIAAFLLSGIGLGLGFVLASPMLVVRDLQRFISKAMYGLMLLTPVIFPAPNTGFFAAVIQWNPLTAPMLLGSLPFSGGSASLHSGLAFSLITAIILLTTGSILFKASLRPVLECLGERG